MEDKVVKLLGNVIFNLITSKQTKLQSSTIPDYRFQTRKYTPNTSAKAHGFLQICAIHIRVLFRLEFSDLAST